MSWSDESPFAVTVCDPEGVIVYMNQKAQATFGGDLSGQNLLK